MAARTVPTVPTWLAGQKLTAAGLNLIGTWQLFWSNRPMFRMHQSVAQSVPNGVWTQITCDTPDYDTDSGRATSTPWSYTIPAGMGGRWRFWWSVPWAANTTGERASNIWKNGAAASSIDAVTPVSALYAGSVGLTDVITVAGGDVMALYGYQSSGAALNAFSTADPSYSFFGGILESLGTP